MEKTFRGAHFGEGETAAFSTKSPVAEKGVSANGHFVYPAENVGKKKPKRGGGPSKTNEHYAEHGKERGSGRHRGSSKENNEKRCMFPIPKA